MIAHGSETHRPWPHWLRIVLGLVVTALLATGIAWLFVTVVPDGRRNIALRTIAVGIAANVSCALVGTYLVLRRMSLLGDAISHAVLPGIVLAVILSGRVEGWPVLAAAMVLGVVTALGAQSLQGLGGVSEDASLGVVYTSLFALGVILLKVFAPHSHIDVDCVLYGLIDVSGVVPAYWLGIPWPPALFKLLPVLLGVVLFIAIGWKELQIVSFDAPLARAIGLPAMAVHVALMGVVALVTVASFEAVGSILVVPMLIVPAATARLLVDRLSSSLVVAALAGMLAAILGYLASVVFRTSAAGMMATVAGGQLGLAVLFSPRYGLVSRWLRNLLLAVKIAAEDIVARLYRVEERGLEGAAEEDISVGWLVRLLARLEVRRKGWIASEGGRLQLTSRGRQQAQSIVRAHRLWESYLATHFELAPDHLHEPAERMEHFIDADLQGRIANELAGQSLDPHGSPIPPADEETSRQ
jgi:manganese/zinc/iron transport system permease protein